MFIKILITIIIEILLLYAAISDYKKGEVEYWVSFCIFIVGLIGLLVSNKAIMPSNFLWSLSIFLSLYAIYIISALLNRNGLGGADVLILSALSIWFGSLIVWITLLACFINIIYILIKSYKNKLSIKSVKTKFIPFIFFSNIFLFCVIFF